MVAAKRRIQEKEREQGRRTPFGEASRKRQPGSGYDETVQRVQDWNRAIKGSEDERAWPEAPTLPLNAGHTQMENSPLDVGRALARKSGQPQAPSLKKLRPAEDTPTPPIHEAGKLLQPKPGLSSVIAISARVDPPRVGVDTQGDIWDDDFEGSITSLKLATHDPQGAKIGAPKLPRDRHATVRSPLVSKTVSPTLAASSAAIEDYSDLLDEEQSNPFEGRIASLKVRHRRSALTHSIRFADRPAVATCSQALNQQSRILHPNDISGASTSAVEDRHVPKYQAYAPGSAPGSSQARTARNQASTRPKAETSTPEDESHLDRFKEQEEDYSDVFESPCVEHEPETLQLTAKLSSRSWVRRTFSATRHVSQ